MKCVNNKNRANPAWGLGVAEVVLSHGDEKERNQFNEVGHKFEGVIRLMKPADHWNMRNDLWRVALNHGVLRDD